MSVTKKGASMVSNEFTCPNGHKFSANAKLRARCSNCGTMARRNFSSTLPEQKKTITKITGVRKPSESSSPIPRKVDKSKILRVGSKPVLTSKTEEQLSDKPRRVSKGLQESPTSTKQLKVIRQGRPRTVVKKAVPKTPAVVHRKKVRAGTHPMITKKPHGSKERKVIEAQTGGQRFWEKAKTKYFK